MDPSSTADSTVPGVCCQALGAGCGGCGGCSLGCGVGDLWQRLGLSLLALTGLSCIHAVLYHLHAILVPFVLSGFIVLALQPSVEIVYRFLAGRVWPFRWFGFFCSRRLQRDGVSKPTNSDNGAKDGEARDETEPLLGRSDNSADDGCCQSSLLDTVCRGLAVTIVFFFVLFVAAMAFLGLCKGAMHMKDNWESYKIGLQRLEIYQENAIDTVSANLKLTRSMEERLREAAVMKTVLGKAQDLVWTIVNFIVSGVSEGLSSLALMMLYVLFWLFQPLPTGGTAGALVRSYLYKKSLVSALYGVCVTVLFASLGVDLAILFGVISFFLNFVPEIGAFIAMIVPIPIILLDGRLSHPFSVLAAATIGNLVLKFIFGNLLEVKLIERDRHMSIHPVWVILGLSYFGFIWGPIGMMISVPMLAMLKTAVMSSRVTIPIDNGLRAIADAFVACLEGGRVWEDERKTEEVSKATKNVVGTP
eukprot:TRINITY_DN29041_c0_g1_i1.p1 TRINITY_DN29041_c0_g1~~TRINITY_DN29041_c0_g1_i1.p1  ORF type:complete len:475 (-),score=69.38 TRINITY_DN29041_c0_g1_i1:206-1630(-)